MADTLYRRYRPTTFADLVDQRHVRITLEHALTQDRIAHAYLFTGPRGVGKTTVARVFARAVNCQKRKPTSAEPCNDCSTCTAQLTGASLDVVEIDAASQTGVENVRENIIQSARSIPSQGKYKVFIIDEVHMLSTSAFNALLKLLEEPPSHALFILATTELHRIPETVVSRTQRFDFKKIPLADMTTRLEKIAVAEKRKLETGLAERIARAAGGSLRDAESMLTQLFSFPETTISLELADLVLPRSDRATLLAVIEAVIRGQTAAALSALHRFIDDGGDIPIFVHELTIMSRAVVLASVDRRLMEAALTTEDGPTLAAIADIAAIRDQRFLTALAEAFIEAELRTQHAPIPEFPVEVAIITLGGSGEATGSTVGPSVTTTPQPSAPTTVPPPAGPLPAKTGVAMANDGKKSVTKDKKSDTSMPELTAVHDAWTTVQQQAAADHPGLALSIKLAKVFAVEGSKVVIAAPFKLHAERLNTPTQRVHLAELFSTALGNEVTIEVIQAEAVPEPAPSRVDVPAANASAPTAGLAPSGPKNELWDQVVATFS